MLIVGASYDGMKGVIGSEKREHTGDFICVLRVERSEHFGVVGVEVEDFHFTFVRVKEEDVGGQGIWFHFFLDFFCNLFGNFFFQNLEII